MNFEALYTDNEPKVRAYAKRRVPEADVDDVVSDTFEQAWRSLDHYKEQDGKPAIAWLYTIAHSRIVDFYRKQHPTANIDEMAIQDRLNIEAHSLVCDDLRLVRSAIARLSPDQRLATTLRIQGVNASTIAKRTGKPEGAIRGAQHRALVNLRKAIA